MGFSDAFKKRTEPHVDSPAQAKARAEAVATVKAKADARIARDAARDSANKEKVRATGASAPKAT